MTSYLGQMQADIEGWLEIDDNILRDMLVFHGDLKPGVKFVSAERFTETISNSEEVINHKKFYPRIFLAATGSVGTGLERADAYAVYRIGFPTSIFEIA